MSALAIAERAARAIGLTVHRTPPSADAAPGAPWRLVTDDGREFNPEHNADQAEQIRVVLGLVVKQDSTGSTVQLASGPQHVLARVFKTDDASIRTAIVLTAAAMTVADPLQQ